MSPLSKKDPFLLFFGDIIIFYISLWLTLLVRYRGDLESTLLHDHVVPFSILFAVWFIVYYIAGLYEKRSIVLRNHLPLTLLQAQIVNSVVAVLFFYFIPYFGITPKTNLFIYLVISFFLILIWRIYGYRLLGQTRRQHALLIASGEEMRELYEEVNSHPHYNLLFLSSVDLASADALEFNKQILEHVNTNDISLVVVDYKNTKVEAILPELYKLLFSGVVFIDMHKVYEDVFDRIPLSLITYRWVLESISLAPKTGYDIFKRLMDFAGGFLLGIVFIILFPFLYIALKLDDRGPLFFFQERVGVNGKIYKNIKFRTLPVHSERDGLSKNPQPTKLQKMLRNSRVDELPQLWNVIKGDLSIVGPRPELPVLVELYEKEIPYYSIRHLIKPGLFGWAQIYHTDPPRFFPSAEKTKMKLAYDLYYIKNRSLLLDIEITLKTIKIILSRSGT